MNRRKVAAISFLANIRVEGEKESDLPGYRCLMGTQVMDCYRKNRCRRKLGGRMKTVTRKEKECGVALSSEGSRERTPEVTGESNTKRCDGSRRGERGSVGSRGRRQLVYTSQWSDDNMLDVGGGGQHIMARRVNSSQESIMGGQLVSHNEPRARQLSGNMSEHSHNSSLKARNVCSA